MTRAEARVAGLPAGGLIADTASDADGFRRPLGEAGITAVMPSHPARARAVPFDRHLAKERPVVAGFFARIKPFRRIATRYEKTAANFLAFLHLAAAMIWLR